MQPSTRYWLILLATISLGAIVRSTVPARSPVPATKVLADFPSQIGEYSVTRSEFADSEKTRRAYTPAAIVYRDYSDHRGSPINIFIAPEIVGWDSPSICAIYQGSTIIRRTELRVAAVPGLAATEIVLRSPVDDQMNICAYYWRDANDSVNDEAIQLLKGKVAVLTGVSSFRVDMCTEAKDISEIAAASERLRDFAALVDPALQRLLQKAMVARK
jgi:Protein of unknown function (DUF3485)